MTSSMVEGALGRPDFAAAFDAGGGKKEQVQTEFFVVPRDYAAQLAGKPVARDDFAPLTMRVMFQNDRVVAISLGDSRRVFFPKCQRSADPGRVANGAPVSAPYDFATFGLGTPLAAAVAALGPLTHMNDSKDSVGYWPIPITFDVSTGTPNRITEIEIAADMQSVGISPVPSFSTVLDEKTCLVTGYRFSKGF